MNRKEFTTVQEILDYLIEAKSRIEKLKKKNPDLSISVASIDGLSIDLIFELEAYLNDGKSYIGYNDGVKQSGEYLSLSGWSSKLPVYISFSSVKVKSKAAQPVKKDAYEAA